MTATGTYQMQFSLFDQPTGGTRQGAMITNSSVNVANGVFTVQLDFGSTAFAAGAARHLEIAVKKSSETNYTVLMPRQQITSSPYSVRTISAGVSDGLSSACVACVTNQQIAAVDGAKVTGGSNITNLNASNLTSGTVPLARLGTNTPTATTFLRGDNTWAMPSSGSSSVSLQVSATITQQQTISALFGTGTFNTLSYNNVITAPTAGTYNGTTFTANTGGTYLITAAVLGVLNGQSSPTGSGSTNVGMQMQLLLNGAPISFSTYDLASSATAPQHKNHSTITTVVALNAGDTLSFRAASWSNSQPSYTSTDGSARLLIVKLN